MALGKVFGCVLVAVCLSAMSDAFNNDQVEMMTFDDSSESDLETVQVDETMATFEHLQQLFDDMKANDARCSCAGLTCKCCVKIKVGKFRANSCLNLSYNPKAGTATVSLTVDRHKVFRKTFHVSRPISPCINYKVAKICLQFYNFRVDKKTLTGCTKITAKAFGKRISINLGCFRIKFLDSSMHLPFAEFPVVEENSEKILNLEKDVFGEEGPAIDEDNNS